jgi:hypothetical protein
MQLICVAISYFTMLIIVEKDTDGTIAAELKLQRNGASSVYNMSFTLFLFHFAVILLLIPKAECSRYVHDGGWCIKFFIVILAYSLFFLADVEVFKVWA